MKNIQKELYEEIENIPNERLEEFLNIAKSFSCKGKKEKKENNTIGLFADCPEIIDSIINDVMKDRGYCTNE
ncbi:MAG: hypothetical protein HUU50_02330 [Candidatus Brocadiae bacterium]|nr:hypothetical protein [Candidatus Brocadiia bacterium]